MQEEFIKLAEEGKSAEELADLFLAKYYNHKKIEFPINPFDILKSFNVLLAFRPLSNLEGMFIPESFNGDCSIVGINVTSVITRQRFTAAHELCHYLKDAKTGILCYKKYQNSIEKFADEFAASILMPIKELVKQVNKYKVNEFVSFEDVVRISHYFGVSFQACLFRIAYQLHAIEGDISPSSLLKKCQEFQPDLHRNRFGLDYCNLYAQLFDSLSDQFNISYNNFTLTKFKNDYVYNDSRMEGVLIKRELASEIVIDLTNFRQSSKYCDERNKNIIEVAGLSEAYDYSYDNCNNNIDIYEVSEIHKKLYSLAPCPDFGGRYRDGDTIVLGGKFETINYFDIPNEMNKLNKEVVALIHDSNSMKVSDYVKRVADIHYKLTVIHPFGDGNGRTSRAFSNMLLFRLGLPPIFFIGPFKKEYKDALKSVDDDPNSKLLYEVFFKSMLDTYSKLIDSSILLD